MGDPLNIDMSNVKDPEAQAAHEAAMIAAADKGVTNITSTTTVDGQKSTTVLTQEMIEEAQATGERPEGIPEKFWDVENKKVNVAAMLKAQQDAEAALRATQQKQKVDEPEEGTEDAPTDGQANVIATASEEYTSNGELSEETFTKLEKVGLSRDMVNEYIAGQQAILNSLQQSAFSAFNGDATQYEEAAKWAANNLTDDEIAALDVQVQSTNPAIVRAGAEALAKAYAEGRDIEPTTTLQSGGNTGGTSGGYKSGAEMRADMANPRYKADPAFRAEVSAKIAKSTANLFG